MDRILIKRSRITTLSSGLKMHIQEPTAYEADLLLSVITDRLEERIDELQEMFSLWCAEELPWPLPANDFSAVVSCAAELVSCNGILSFAGSEQNSGASCEDMCPDASLFQMLDAVCGRYGGSPFDLYKKLTYRQIMYAYTMAYNARIDEITLQGGKQKNGKPLPKMYAGGLSMDKSAMSEKDKMAYYAKMAKKLRGERNGR